LKILNHRRAVRCWDLNVSIWLQSPNP
jgi:hypothetical protein